MNKFITLLYMLFIGLSLYSQHTFFNVYKEDEIESEKYDAIYRSGGYHIIKKDSLYGFLDSLGNLKQKPIFERVDLFFKNKISVKYNSKWVSWSEEGINYDDQDLYFYNPEVYPAYDNLCINEHVKTTWFKSCSRRRMLSDWYAHIDYPKEVREKNIQGKVWVRFVINENGQVEDVELIRGIGEECDDEVLDAVNFISDWVRPGSTISGINIKTVMTEAISFSIE